jgi:hypothetical protein
MAAETTHFSAIAAALQRKSQRPLRPVLVVANGPTPSATAPKARYHALPALLEAITFDPCIPP